MAVLAEAQRRMLSIETLAAAVAGERDPRRQLQAFLGAIVQVLTGPESQSWAVRLFGREFVAPSAVCWCSITGSLRGCYRICAFAPPMPRKSPRSWSPMRSPGCRGCAGGRDSAARCLGRRALRTHAGSVTTWPLTGQATFPYHNRRRRPHES